MSHTIDTAAVTFNMKVDTEMSSFLSILLMDDTHRWLIETEYWQVHHEINIKLLEAYMPGVSVLINNERVDVVKTIKLQSHWKVGNLLCNHENTSD